MSFLRCFLILLIVLIYVSCNKEEPETNPGVTTSTDLEGACGEDEYQYVREEGCDGQIYPDPLKSPYIIPFATGTEFNMGLSNCSSSYHGSGQPDEYAYDFDFPTGTPFIAARSGEVAQVIEDRSNNGGDLGNWVIIDHGDETYAWYLHSPTDGIIVEEGDMVKQGDVLGEVGKSGLAGYPHLHFIVTQGQSINNYDGIPVTFSNFAPLTTVLESYTTYKVCE